MARWSSTADGRQILGLPRSSPALQVLKGSVGPVEFQQAVWLNDKALGLWTRGEWEMPGSHSLDLPTV